MAQQNWWEQDQVVSPPTQAAPVAAPATSAAPAPQIGAGAAPGVIYGRPKTLAPTNPLDDDIKRLTIQDRQADLAITPYEARIAAANADKAEAEAAKVAAGGVTPLTAAQRNDLVGQRNSLRLFEDRLNEIENLYEQDFKGARIGELPYAIGVGDITLDKVMPKSWKGKAERFDAAGGTLMGELKAALGMTGGEANTAAEVELRFGPYIPKASDSDEAIEQKLSMLRSLLRSETRGIAEKLGEPEQQEASSTPVTREQSRAIWGEELSDADGNPLGPDGGQSFDANGNPRGFAAAVENRIQPDATPPADGSGGQSAGQGFMAGVGDVAQGFGDIAGLVGNPANATLNQIFGTNLSTDLGLSLREALGLPENQNRVASAVNRAGAGALGIAGLARTGVRLAGDVVQNALNTMAAQPGRQILAAGAGGGTAEQLAQEGVGPIGQLGGALVAGGLTYSGGNALMNTAERLRAQPNALMSAAQRQNVDILPADVGGPMTRRVTAAAAQAPVSASPVVNASQRSRDQLSNAANRAATRQGDILEPDVAGESVRTAGRQYIKNESSRIGQMYARAGEAAKGVRIKPQQALVQIDEQIGRFSELGDVGAGMVSTLQSIRSSIQNGVSVQGMRDARTILSQGVYDGKLRSNQEKKILGDIIDALSSDIELGLRQAGREGAARQFKRADTLWRERIQYIDDVLEPIIGKGKSGEDVLRAIESMARGQRGGVSRLRGVMREMPSEEAGNIRATIIDRMGKASAGQQNDTGTAFSAETFLTNWNKMSSQAKAVMFSDEGLRSNLDDIAKLANATREAGRYANRSNTSGGILGNVGAAGGLAYFSPTAAVLTLGSQFLTGRLMASPRFAAWLARAPKNPAAQERYVAQLSSLAAKEPAIAGDAKALQQYLMERVANTSGVKAAASENGEDPRPEPPQ